MGLGPSMRVGLMKKQYSGSLTLTFIPTLKIRRLPKKKSHRLSAAEYADLQEQFDEQESSSSVLELIETVHTLPPEKIAELLNFLQHGQ